MAPTGQTRIQLCGRFVVRLEGQRIEDSLSGPLGQLLFAYLVLNRLRRIDSDELLLAVYGEEAPADHHARFSVLLSKLRRVVGAERLSGRAQLELVLPADVFVDVDAALEALHRAESRVAKGGVGPGLGAVKPCLRHREPAPAPRPRPRGLDDWRRRLDDARLSGLECLAAASLGLGGPELPQAVNCARRLIELAPLCETGHLILMEALARGGNVAEALRVYDRLRVTLREELGIAPGPAVQEVHRRLVGGAARNYT
jgi:pentatricopeptide repeat protein